MGLRIFHCKGIPYLDSPRVWSDDWERDERTDQHAFALDPVVAIRICDLQISESIAVCFDDATIANNDVNGFRCEIDQTNCADSNAARRTTVYHVLQMICPHSHHGFCRDSVHVFRGC